VELRQLEHFVAVAEERHFSRAAQRVHIVQSGLSSSIRSLERELGAELFVRSTRRVELTEAGREFLPEARSTLAAAQRARDAVAGVEGLLRGRLAVGIMQVLDPVDLPALLARFRSEHPGVEVRLRQGAASVLVDEVRAGELDLAFVGLPEERLRGVDATVLTDEAMPVACARSHPLVKRSEVRLRDLRDETFVEFPPDWGARIAIDHTFAAAGIVRRIAFELNDVKTLLELVANGLGISIVPRSVSAYRLPVELLPLRGRAPRWRLSLVTRASEQRSAATRALVEMLGLGIAND
jgi:DNA-binding transcriptional LysR family regulator